MKKYLLLLSLISCTLFAQTPGYYNGTEDKKGDELKAALHEIINDHIDISYSDAKFILNYAQEDPNNTSNLIQFYTGKSLSKDSWGTGGNNHNREHVWAKSHGAFADIRPMDGDAHNLHAADASVNITRSNYDFAEVTGGTYIDEADAYYGNGAFEPSDRDKGEVARTILYMAVRYEGTDGEMDLEVEDKIGTYPNATHGKLSDLLKWNRQYPPTDMERRRNDRVEQCQGNRNPFTDNPAWADMIWADSAAATVYVYDVALQTKAPKVGDLVHLDFRTNNATTAKFLWGSSYDNITNEGAIINETGTPGFNTIEFMPTGVAAGELVYCKMIASGADDADTLLTAFYLAPEVQLVAMSAVQGTGASSPLSGQVISIGGIVTANFDNVFTMQSKGTRNAMTVYSNWRGRIGDSVVVTGKVYEYQGLTEISPATLVYSYGAVGEYEPDTLTIAELSEDNESQVVVLKSVNFVNGGETFDQNSGSYQISDGLTNINVFVRYDSRLAAQDIPNGSVNVKAVYTEYGGTYQLIVNDMSWITKVVDNTPPSIVNVEAIDKDWIYIYFNESITADCANNKDNFSFNNGLDIIAAYHYPPNKAIVMVSNLEMKEYSVTVKNIEDLSGNILSEDSASFRSEFENETLAVQDDFQIQFNVFPNPVSDGRLTISAIDELKTIAIFALNGQLLYDCSDIQALEYSLDVSFLEVGNYILQVKSENATLNTKISIK